MAAELVETGAGLTRALLALVTAYRSRENTSTLSLVVFAHDDAREQLKHADGKVKALLGLVTAVLAGVVTLNLKDLPTLSTVALWVATVLLVGSVLALLDAIRPRMSGEGEPGTWLHAAHHGWETLVDTSLVPEVVVARDTAEVAKTVLRKHRRVQVATALLAVGLFVLAAGLAVGMV
ncbi:Pycsar system effector family protein [Saccharomonospora azurea]|uniref:Pycsar system effector family protein n=1 Tax=Saccharomonospora azurea TaxID=40988 RepID=UPI0033179A95